MCKTVIVAFSVVFCSSWPRRSFSLLRGDLCTLSGLVRAGLAAVTVVVHTIACAPDAGEQYGDSSSVHKGDAVSQPGDASNHNGDGQVADTKSGDAGVAECEVDVEDPGPLERDVDLYLVDEWGITTVRYLFRHEMCAGGGCFREALRMAVYRSAEFACINDPNDLTHHWTHHNWFDSAEGSTESVRYVLVFPEYSGQDVPRTYSITAHDRSSGDILWGPIDLDEHEPEI
ncbi:hypothetical protein ACFL6C_01900 [Myxococcota bacterium]